MYTIWSRANKKQDVFSQEYAIMGDALQNKPVFLLNLYKPEHNDGYITCAQDVTMDETVINLMADWANEIILSQEQEEF